MTELACPHCRKTFSIEARSGVSAGAPHGSAPMASMRRMHICNVLLVVAVLMFPVGAMALKGHLSMQGFTIACSAMLYMALIAWPLFRWLWTSTMRRLVGQRYPGERDDHRV